MRRLAWLAMITLVGCGDPAPLPAAREHAVEPNHAARPATADDRQHSRTKIMTGVLVPTAEVTLVAPSFAQLERLNVQVGDHVEHDAVVAEMDVRGNQAQLAVATDAWKASAAELDRLTLELEQAKATRADVEQLEQFVAKAELREQRYAEKLAAARTRSAGASLRQQRSRMKEAELRIAQAELRAPFTGAVARRHVDAGATLSAGDPVLELVSDDRRLRFAVPEWLSARLKLGATIAVEFVDEGIQSTGKVTTIAPEIEAGTRLIFAEALVDLDESAARVLRIGSVGRVSFIE